MSSCTLLNEVNIAGDFAVLLRSGMTVKQALMYNMVSSVLAFGGMCLGIVLGTLHWAASSWVFTLTAGIFIYVSLVDMVRTFRPVLLISRLVGGGSFSH